MSQSNVPGTCRRFSHTPPRHSKTTDSLGGIKPNADLLCYMRFTEKARPPEDGNETNMRIYGRSLLFTVVPLPGLSLPSCDSMHLTQ